MSNWKTSELVCLICGLSGLVIFAGALAAVVVAAAVAAQILG